MEKMNMKVGLYIFLQITWTLVNVVIGAWSSTAISVKENAVFDNKNDNVDVIEGEHFEELIKNSEIWVDESLFIKEIWRRGASVFMIPCPRRGDKTITLEMVKFFHQTPLKEDGSVAPLEHAPNFLYFKHGQIWNGEVWKKTTEPPLISKYPDYLEHLGKHPVIHLIGRGLNASSEETARTTFAKMIFKAYDEHRYLLDYLTEQAKTSILARDDLDDFNKYYLGSKSDSLSLLEYSGSIETLSEILNKTFKQNVIVVFDDHDGFIGKTHFSSEALPPKAHWAEFKSDYLHFLRSTFKQNESMIKSIITGITLIRETSGLSGFNNADILDYEELHKQINGPTLKIGNSLNTTQPH